MKDQINYFKLRSMGVNQRIRLLEEEGICDRLEELFQGQSQYDLKSAQQGTFDIIPVIGFYRTGAPDLAKRIMKGILLNDLAIKTLWYHSGLKIVLDHFDCCDIYTSALRELEKK